MNPARTESAAGPSRGLSEPGIKNDFRYVVDQRNISYIGGTFGDG